MLNNNNEMLINKIFHKVGGAMKYIIFSFALYYPILYFMYKGNFWKIYNSYHVNPQLYKRIVWNKYMIKNSGSISIEAEIASPLILPHGVSGIFITRSAKIGRNVVVFQQVTIGANTIRNSKSYGAPIIGDNVYIGAGAKIIGLVKIEDNVRIGANAVVVKNVPYNSLVLCEKSRIIVKEEKLDNSFYPYLEENNLC